MNSFSKIITIMICVVSLFLIPIYYNSMMQDEVSQAYIQNVTNKFTNEIRNSGVLTKEMYEDYIAQIDSTNNIYDVSITHAHRNVLPKTDSDEANETSDYITNTMEYYANTYTDTILNKMYNGATADSYHFTKGDYITVQVYNKNRTFAGRIQAIFSKYRTSDIKILVTSGGVIKDELE